jgi:glycine cleavage system H protein
MSIVPPDLMYTKEHEWIKEDVSVVGDLKSATMGITDFAQAALGDIVYVQLPKVGQSVVAGQVCGEVESTKSVSEIFSPLTGTVTAVNLQLDKSPELLNQDPYGAGWIAVIEYALSPAEALTASEYELLTA